MGKNSKITRKREKIIVDNMIYDILGLIFCGLLMIVLLYYIQIYINGK